MLTLQSVWNLGKDMLDDTEESSIYLFFSLKVSKFSHECLFRREPLRLQEVK